MADWTVNDPIKVKHDIVPQRQGSPLDLRVFVRFQDDATPTTNKFPDASQEAKIYTARGVGAWDRVREGVRLDRLTLNQGELPPADGETFAPTTAPTPQESAISDAVEARRKLRNLSAYQAESGKANAGELGTSGITFAQARDSLTTEAEADITNQSRLGVFIEKT